MPAPCRGSMSFRLPGKDAINEVLRRIHVATAPVMPEPIAVAVATAVPAPVTAPVPAPAVPAAPHKAGFIRLIDKVSGFFHAHGGEVLQCAEAAEPFVAALTPFGLEYDLVVNAIVGMRRTASAAQAAGVQMTGADQMKAVFAATAQPLSSILDARGVAKDDHDAAIATFLQAIYSLHTLPAVPAANVAPSK